MFQMGSTGVRFTMELPDDPVTMLLDRRLMTQAITNLVKNAAEAAQAVLEQPDAPKDFEGLVETRLTSDGTTAVVEVIDNGVGLSKAMRSRLLEPYVTTKAKGTGLGLAIVQKIVEQHGGRLELTDAPITATRTSGAAVRMHLPVRATANEAVVQTDIEPKLATTAK